MAHVLSLQPCHNRYHRIMTPDLYRIVKEGAPRREQAESANEWDKALGLCGSHGVD
jgi:hypothetical protein